MRRLRLLGSLCAVLAALAGCNDNALPPGGTYSTVHGLVLDHATNMPIADATVTLDTILVVTTGPDGTFTAKIPSGDFDYVVQAKGYKTTDPPLHGRVDPDKTIDVTVALDH